MLDRRLPQTEQTGHTGHTDISYVVRGREPHSFGPCADETPA
jgi:hypothetical protein